MAEFLVRVHNKVNPDSVYADVKCLKRGDVVTVCPDGWPWSASELTNAFWRIVKVPAMTMSEAQAFLAGEPGDPITNKMLQRRQFKLDVDSATLTTAVRDWIADDTRAVPYLEVALLTSRSLKTLKPPILDPNVIG